MFKKLVLGLVLSLGLMAMPSMASAEDTTTVSACACGQATCLQTLQTVEAPWYKGVYIEPKALWSINYTKVKNNGDQGQSGHHPSFGAGLAVGYDFSKTQELPIRVELEYMVNGSAERNFKDFHSDISYDMLSGNVLYDFMEVCGFKPYVGCGVGFANVHHEVSCAQGFQKHSEVCLALQGMVGVSYPIMSNVDVDLMYRFQWLSDHSGHYNDHYVQLQHNVDNQLLLGLRLTF